MKALLPTIVSRSDRSNIAVRLITLVAAFAAAMLVGFVPAGKAENLRSTPQLTVHGTSCGFNWGGSRSIQADYSILAANRYYGYVETQTAYVRTALFKWTSSGWTYVATGGWTSGLSSDLIGPQVWYRHSDGAYLGGPAWRDSWSLRTPGHFLIKVQFAWDTSSTGAPSGSSGWFSSPNYCTN